MRASQVGDVMGKRVGLLVGLPVLVLGTGVVAQPPSPSPEPPPWFGGRVEMPEHGFAVTVPDGWVAFDLAGDIADQLDAVDLVLFSDLVPQDHMEEANVWASTGAQMVLQREAGLEICYLFSRRLVNQTIEGMVSGMFEWAVRDTAHRDVESPEFIDLPVGETYLIRQEAQVEPFLPEQSADPWTPSSWYLIGSADDRYIFLDCNGGYGRPDDDWLPIVETIEFLPAEE